MHIEFSLHLYVICFNDLNQPSDFDCFVPAVYYKHVYPSVVVSVTDFPSLATMTLILSPDLCFFSTDLSLS